MILCETRGVEVPKYYSKRSKESGTNNLDEF